LKNSTLLFGFFIFIIWSIAGLISDRPIEDAFILVLTQSGISICAFILLYKFIPSRRVGPEFGFIICLHYFIYYSISNIVPALLPGIRPIKIQVMLERIPLASAWSYGIASIASGLLVFGLIIGAYLSQKFLPLLPIDKREAKFIWFPGYRLNVYACNFILLVVIYGTLRFGLNEIMVSEQLFTDLSLFQQMVFHGLFYFLPIAPLLAAFALVRATTLKQRRFTYWLLAMACLITFFDLSILGQRSTAIIALLVPIVFLAFIGKINFRQIILPTLVGMVFIYAGVTLVRDSNLRYFLSNKDSDISLKTFTSILTTQNENKDVLGHAIADISYRTAGLEAVAAFIQKHNEDVLAYQYGITVGSGFIQALPRALRHIDEMPEQIKIAPSYLGIFDPGDWVTTILAEFTLDFGPFWLFFPAIIAGFIFGMIDRILLIMGQTPQLEGLLILRIVFLLYIISNGGSLAGMTLLLFKATIGYTILLIFISTITRISISKTRLLQTQD